MRSSFVVAALLLLNIAQGQESRKYNLKEVGWTIELPPGFNVMDSAEDAARNARGKQSIEKVYGKKFDGTVKTLISATKGPCYFNATLSPYDPKKNGDWASNINLAKELLYKMMLNIQPGTLIDSSSTLESIDGVRFEKFHIIAAIKEREIHCFLYARRHKQYIFGITYVYGDELTGKQLADMMRKSRFK